MIIKLLAAALLFSNSLLVIATEKFAVETPATRIAAPDFILPNLAEIDVQLADYKGQVVVLHFWATWCAPCRQEMPSIQNVWQQYQNQDVVVLSISADKGSDKRIHAFQKKYGLSFPILRDPQAELQKSYDVMGLPMTYVIGRDGKISGRVIGARQWDTPAAIKYIEKLL